MASELGVCLAKVRCQEEQDEILNKWTELSTLDLDLSPFRPVYSPKDFLDILAQISSPNLAEHCRPWGVISIPLSVPNLDQLREKFSELAKGEPHLGLNPLTSSSEDPGITLETERYNLGQKVSSVFLKCIYFSLVNEKYCTYLESLTIYASSDR